MAQPFQFTGGYDADVRDIERRRRMAEMLQGQAMEPLATNRMAGGYVVPINPMEGIAKIAQAWAAGKRMQRADDDYRKLGETMAADRADVFQRAIEAANGRPQIEAPPADLGGGPGRPAMPGSQQAMYRVLMGAKDPQIAQIGLAGMLKGMEPQKPKMQRVEIPDGRGGVRVGFVDLNNPNPMSTFTEGGAQPAKPEMVNTGGQVVPVNPYTQQGPLQVTPAPGAVPFAAQGMTPEQYRSFQERKAAAGASRTTNINNVNAKPDNAYFTERRKAQAQKFQDLEKAAESADKQIQALDRFLKANETGTAGGAQPLISGVQNFLSSFGYESKALTDVRVMEQVIGDILQNKMAELGARGLTDKDMQILRDALPRVATDRRSRAEVAGVIRRAAEGTINSYRAARDEEARIYPEFTQNTPSPLWLRRYDQPQGGVRQDAPAGRGRVVVDY